MDNMSFYHILPSNTSPEYFPNNNASEYSTPIDYPYDLTGNWEVGLMDLTHSTCINTFNNNCIIVEEEKTVIDDMQKMNNPVKVMIPMPSQDSGAVEARRELTDYINKKFKSILRLRTSDNKMRVHWDLISKDFYFILSKGIQVMYQVWSDVVSPFDKSFVNLADLNNNNYLPKQASDLYIIMVPMSSNPGVIVLEKVVLKKKNEEITVQELHKRFETLVRPGVIKVTLNPQKQFKIEKLHDDNNMIMYNPALLDVLTFTHACNFRASIQAYYTAKLKDFSKEWVFSILHIKNISVLPYLSSKTVTLSPHSFANTTKATSFVTEMLGDKRITLKCDKTNHVNLSISVPLTVTFDNNLRDIFGFDKNTYSGPISITSDRMFSLNRCIQFLYIYSNLGNTVRVGNTKAPLLAIVPFSANNKGSILKEKVFKEPMYVGMRRNRITQINIAIYDGAGQLVPFASDAVTTLRLHFRQI